MTTGTEPQGIATLYRLLAWLSPSFPTGAFSYSHGLEAAVATGAVRDRSSLEAWVKAIVVNGSGRIDADILYAAWRAAATDDDEALAAANRQGLAYRATAELALESTQQGTAFIAAYKAAWSVPVYPHPNPPPPAGEGDAAVAYSLDGANSPCSAGGGGQGGGAAAGDTMCHAAAFGVAAARAGIELADALLGYLQAFAANLVAAGLRLGIIGQTDGQRILAAMEPVVTSAAREAMTRDPKDFGGATFAADLASMAHETQYSRLFRS